VHNFFFLVANLQTPAAQTTPRAWAVCDVKRSRLRGPLLAMPISHTFEVESTDHCETPATAYKDVAPALAHLAALMGKSKVRKCACARGTCNLPPLARQSCSCGAKHPLSFTPCCRTRFPRSTRAPFLFPRFFLGCAAHVVAACCLLPVENPQLI